MLARVGRTRFVAATARTTTSASATAMRGTMGRGLATASDGPDLSHGGIAKPGADLSPELQKKIEVRDKELRDKNQRAELRDAERRKRLIWRSKQRGWLEVDLLMGSWAVDNVMKLKPEELDQYERIVNLETIDMYNVVSGRVEPSDDLKGPVLDRLRAYADSNPIRKDPKAYADTIKAKMAN